MEPCKHWHIDGAMHKPCYQCKVEALEAENLTLRNVGVTLQAENEQLRKDAERYRWLRSENRTVAQVIKMIECKCELGLDREIDRAMAETK